VIASAWRAEWPQHQRRCRRDRTAKRCAAVVAQGADLGIALDGDGDRLMMVDATGRLYDGDQLLYVIARSALASGGWPAWSAR
jgi:phosphomannomutase